MNQGEFHEAIARQRLADTQKLIVFRVRANPEPNKVLAFLYRNRPVMNADSRGPKSPHLLEMQ